MPPRGGWCGGLPAPQIKRDRWGPGRTGGGLRVRGTGAKCFQRGTERGWYVRVFVCVSVCVCQYACVSVVSMCVCLSMCVSVYQYV